VEHKNINASTVSTESDVMCENWADKLEYILKPKMYMYKIWKDTSKCSHTKTDVMCDQGHTLPNNVSNKSYRLIGSGYWIQIFYRGLRGELNI